jgi:hypothetical protein
MSRSAEYRKQAEHCRELADGELLRLYRDEFLNLAQIWEQLATQAECEVGVAGPDLRRAHPDDEALVLCTRSKACEPTQGE